MLPDYDLVGDSMTIVSACVTNSNIWISTALGLTNLERVCWYISSNKSVEGSDKCCRAVRLLNFTRCYRTDRPRHVAWSCSLGVTKSFQESPNNCSGSGSVIGIVLGWHRSCCQSLAIWLLSHCPVVESDVWSVRVQALNAHYINISIIIVFQSGDFSSYRIDCKMTVCVIISTTSCLYMTRIDIPAKCSVRVREETEWCRGCNV